MENIILNLKRKFGNGEDLNANIICDRAKWKIPEDIKAFVDELAKNSQISNEDKILLVFERLCKDYIYDDNVLSYMKKIEDDKFALPDWYGREVDTDWEKNREEHNKRVCYEISRYLAKALSELFKENDDINVCILWDIDLTHYYVGLTSGDYTITLDLDNFNNIKDLTRLKTGLTIDGIEILEDDKNKFRSALARFNKGRDKHAIKKMESEVENTTVLTQDESQEEPDDIAFLRNAMAILSEKYNIDSQGIYEYMKEIVDIKLGTNSREKVWKKIRRDLGKGTIYTRCLVVNIDNKKYIIDVDKKVVRQFDEKEFLEEDADFTPYKKVSRDWREHYDGT